MGILEKIRRWIDDEESERVLEEAILKEKPRNPAEEFIVQVARAVEEVMRRELLPLPQGKVLMPSEYVVFISEEDDKEWRGIKRKGLEEALQYILGQRAKELAGNKTLELKRLSLEIKVDGTLQKGEIRVQHTWEDGSSGKTIISPRMKDFVLPSTQNLQREDFFEKEPSTFIERTAKEPDSTLIERDSDEETRVVKRISELYRLEIWRNGVRQNVIPIYQPEITIGRGSRSKPVDVALQGDLEISRHHLKIIYEGGKFFIVSEGKNPTFIDNYEVPVGRKVSIPPLTMIKVCSYMLRIQPSRTDI
ncbi:MAG: DUF2662 domain-containing protein [Acidobacteria bacterium]|jgi:hypothetical protein|nr:MAG: DUF2662 domain-containing protein [Acidobacteriota bacterium]GIU82720.1 MAG: hypothetical protein KatS3mg006_1784 [Pyrinomonadaceae bacterium]